MLSLESSSSSSFDRIYTFCLDWNVCVFSWAVGADDFYGLPLAFLWRKSARSCEGPAYDTSNGNGFCNICHVLKLLQFHPSYISIITFYQRYKSSHFPMTSCHILVKILQDLVPSFFWRISMTNLTVLLEVDSDYLVHSIFGVPGLSEVKVALLNDIQKYILMAVT